MEVKQMVNKLLNYIKENIDDYGDIKAWGDVHQLTLFMRSNYDYFEMTILNQKCILMKSMNELPGVDQVIKHIQQIKHHTEYPVVLHHDGLTRYRRKSLIKSRVPFIMTDGQMYLPFLGLNLYHGPELNKNKFDVFSPVSQLAFIYLNNHKLSMISATDFAQETGLTTMSASRALNELFDATLLSYEIKGKTNRSKVYQRISNPEYFNKAKKYLRRPYKKVVYTTKVPENALIAGESVLSELTLLNSPQHPVYAIYKNEFDMKSDFIVTNKDLINDIFCYEIQLWDYNPRLLSTNNRVDHVSLYLTLQNSHDDRIKQALDEILRGEEWYTG